MFNVLSATTPEMSIGLDWIRAIANFDGFGLDQDCKSFQKVKISNGFGVLD